MRQNRKNKRFIYLISPNKIKNEKFYTTLRQVLSSKKVSFFQLRLKKEKKKKKIIIAKKIKKICKKYKVKFLINDDVMLAKFLNADGCHLGQKDMNLNEAKKLLQITSDSEMDKRVLNQHRNWERFYNQEVC